VTDDRTVWSALATPTAVADSLCALFEQRGTHAYDEAVTQTEHALQCALLAQTAGASTSTVAAALLHDVGHLLLGAAEHEATGAVRDLRHETVGARFLAKWFPEEVTEPVSLHVTAKRYLCAVGPGYAESLSPASVRSLRLQGGPMTPAEAATWIHTAHADEAVAVRRWDDEAKDPTISVPSIRSFEPLLATLVTIG